MEISLSKLFKIIGSRALYLNLLLIRHLLQRYLFFQFSRVAKISRVDTRGKMRIELFFDFDHCKKANLAFCYFIENKTATLLFKKPLFLFKKKLASEDQVVSFANIDIGIG